MSDKTFLYRAKDAGGKLLYIGVSNMPSIRLDVHSRSTAWHKLATDIEYFEFPDRAAAVEAELAEIKLHCPPFNVAGNPECLVRAGEVKNFTIRTIFPQWEAIRRLTTVERTKIQGYTVALYKADFERRGLSWPE